MFYKITGAVFAGLSLGIMGVRAICISILYSSFLQTISTFTWDKDSLHKIFATFDNTTHLTIFAAGSFVLGLILFVIGLFSRKKKS